MRTRKSSLLVTVLILSVIAITLQVALAQSHNNSNDQQNDPPLSETIEWLKGKADEVVGIYSLSVSSGNTVENVGNISLSDGGKIVAEVSNNCSFAWRVVKEVPPSQPSTQQNSNAKKDNKSKNNSGFMIVIPASPENFGATSVSFPFSDINPENIVVIKAEHRNQGGILRRFGHADFDWWVKLYTTDKKKSVRWQNATRNEESNGLGIAFRTEEMAQRFAKAVRHAVKLCGGKADKKEPF